jgi:hypothetical protein
MLQKIGVNDCIAFESRHGLRFGMVVNDSFKNVEVVIFEKVTSDISKQNSFKPLSAIDYAMAYHAHMQEVFRRVTNKLSVPQRSIVDIIFILPITEVESGMFHITGSKVAYFMRYYMQADGKLIRCTSYVYL